MHHAPDAIPDPGEPLGPPAPRAGRGSLRAPLWNAVTHASAWAAGSEIGYGSRGGGLACRVGDGWSGLEGRRAVSWGEKSSPGAAGAPRPDPRRLCASGHVADVLALRSVHDLELDRLAFFERADAVALNRRQVHEDVAAAFTLDESVPLALLSDLTLPVRRIVVSPTCVWVACGAARLTRPITTFTDTGAQEKTARAACGPFLCASAAIEASLSGVVETAGSWS